MNKKIVDKIIQQTEDIYNAVADDFSVTRYRVWPGFERLKKYIKPKTMVLDLGCGNGRMAKLVEDMDIIYRGIDNAQPFIEIAKEKFKDRENFHFAVGDILNIELPHENFDTVLFIAVLHHIPTKKLQLQILKNIYQSLKPGGRIIISTWNLWQPNFRKYLLDYKAKIGYGLWRLNDGLVPWKSKGDRKMRYVHSFTKRELSSLLRYAGFEVQEIYYDKKGEKVGILQAENVVAVAVKK